jgi:hypothetical protein
MDLPIPQVLENALRGGFPPLPQAVLNGRHNPIGFGLLQQSTEERL